MCEQYGGVLNPKGNTCCAASCGKCGGSGCSQRPGGSTNCCASSIPSEVVCGPDQNAPCTFIGNPKFGKLILYKCSEKASQQWWSCSMIGWIQLLTGYI